VRTGGTGSEGLFVITGVCILTVVGILVMDGPFNFFNAANRTLLNAAQTARVWVPPVAGGW
jgi:hypothetical protein